MEQAYYKSDAGNICVVIENHEVTRIFFVDEILENSALPSRAEAVDAEAVDAS